MIISYLRIRANDYYSCDLTAEIPVRVIIRAINGDVGLGQVMASRESYILDYINGLKSSTVVDEINITHKSEGVYWTEVKQNYEGPGIYSTVLLNNSMSQLPIIIENGWQLHKILSPTGASLRMVISELERNFEEVKLLRSSNTPPQLSNVLTDKQLAAIQYAHQHGYYELPRQITIEEVGNILGISRSACQERLHRAERSIVSYFVDDYRFMI